jgi:IMP cyclohydrolase
MNEPTENLSDLEYPGRVVALGTDPSGDKAVAVYAITGRSPASQARKLIFREKGIWVEPTDENVLKKGNVDLLVYPAVLIEDAGIAVSNGKQTAAIRDRLREKGRPVPILADALESWDYEPDAPIFTPRIAGCVHEGRSALALLRRGPEGEPLKSYFEIVPRAGKGRAISTYLGPNRDPLPCFAGEPFRLVFAGRTPGEIAEDVFRALGPRTPDRDFRVAVACVVFPFARPVDFEYTIINRHERT